MATSCLWAAAAERAMALAFDGGVAAMAAGNTCRRASAAERVMGVLRTPNRDATRTTLRRGLRVAAVYPPSWSCPLMTVEWLSDDDGPVPLAIVGEADEISYREGGENASQDSPAVRVYIEGL